MNEIVDDFFEDLRALAKEIEGNGSEQSEFSARARKKKRIYKRKKSDPKPSA
jgi:hypothetical protein